MNILTFESEENKSGLIRVNDYRASHLKEVIKVKVGQEIKVGEVGGYLWVGAIEEIDTCGIRIRLKSVVTKPSILELDLIVALPRPQTLKKILELAGCFSVRSLSLIASEKVESSYFQSTALSSESMKKHLILGLQQGVKTHLPKVRVERNFKETIGELCLNFTGNKLLAEKNTSKSFSQIHLQGSSSLLAIGPEGGWIQNELDFFSEREFLRVNLSSSVLRVENAVCSALSQFELIVGGNS